MRLILYGVYLMLNLVASNAISQHMLRDSLRKDSLVASKADEKKRIPYFFRLQTGALIGCNDCSEKKEISFTTSMVHGLTLRNKLRVGVGVGFDSYANWQTLPVFGSLSWDLLTDRNDNALFIQFDHGWAKSWPSITTRAYGYKGADGGRTYGLNLGYRIKYHDLRVSFALGLKAQNVLSYYEYPTYYISITGRQVEGNPSTQVIEEELRRFQLTMAIGWK